MRARVTFPTRYVGVSLSIALAAVAGCSLVNAPDDVKAGGAGGASASSGGGSTSTAATTATDATSTTSSTSTTGSGGAGGTMCPAGTADCDGDPGNGCEKLDTPDHCGSCQTTCAAGDMHVATPLCAMDACDYDVCAEGFGDCDQNRANGCETSLSGDPANCGACGNACGADTPTCDGGVCCAKGLANCDGDPMNGCEVAVSSDPQNCGACGSPCAPGKVCAAGTCQDLRSKLMQCGSSSRDVKTFIPAGASLTLVQSCVPDADTQAIVVTRNFGNVIDAAGFQAYLNGGGIALTEYSISDEVWSLAFGATTQGSPQSGSCQDTAPTVVQFTPNDPFWTANPFVAIPAANTGCGFPVNAFAGIVPLAGWDAMHAAIGYRDLGAGRVWATDFDWQDGEANQPYDYTNDLMRYMVGHRK